MLFAVVFCFVCVCVADLVLFCWCRTVEVVLLAFWICGYCLCCFVDLGSVFCVVLFCLFCMVDMFCCCIVDFVLFVYVVFCVTMLILQCLL